MPPSSSRFNGFPVPFRGALHRYAAGSRLKRLTGTLPESTGLKAGVNETVSVATVLGMYCFRPSMPKFFIKTYGCQMNERDSEQVAHSLAGARLRAGRARVGSRRRAPEHMQRARHG